MSLKDWSTTAASNTSVLGVFIGENAPFSNMNDSQRAIMAETRLEVASFGTVVAAASTPDIGIDGGAHTVTGVITITGFATAPSGVVRTLHFETATPIVPGANLSATFTSLTTSKGDVMVSRSLGSGAWKVEYFNRELLTKGKHKVWIPAAAMTAHPSVPPAFASVLGTSVPYNVWDFDGTAVEATFFALSMPSSWDEGTITFIPVWTAASGSGDVIWALNCIARSNDDAIAGSYSTTVSSTDTLIATGDLHRGPESSALTVDGTPAANDTLFFVVLRNATAGGDTLNGVDARLLGIELFFTTDAAVDVA